MLSYNILGISGKSHLWFEFPAKPDVLQVWNPSQKAHLKMLCISALCAPWALKLLLRGAPYYRPISQKCHLRSFSAVSTSPKFRYGDTLVSSYPKRLTLCCWKQVWQLFCKLDFCLLQKLEFSKYPQIITVGRSISRNFFTTACSKANRDTKFSLYQYCRSPSQLHFPST